jgi:hypothetical protein
MASIVWRGIADLRRVDLGEDGDHTPGRHASDVPSDCRPDLAGRNVPQTIPAAKHAFTGK